jgi:hypothetical protein
VAQTAAKKKPPLMLQTSDSVEGGGGEALQQIIFLKIDLNYYWYRFKKKYGLVVKGRDSVGGATFVFIHIREISK